MNRRHFLAGCVAFAATGAAAETDPLVDQITRQLGSQGFKRIKVGRTLLGRTRIIAYSSDGRREIVLNPRTGEILRDVLYPRHGNSGSRNSGNQIVDRNHDDPASDDKSSGSGSDDDVADDDSSGSSGSSGSGSGDDHSGSDEKDDSHDDSSDSDKGGEDD